VSIEGFAAPGYEPVRDAFAENFTARGESGAGVALVIHGEPVVSLLAAQAQDGAARRGLREPRRRTLSLFSGSLLRRHQP
jgi:hypothetical protein